ncbi:hypothetical protein Dimus_036389 [Dionaea muscipula]
MLYGTIARRPTTLQATSRASRLPSTSMKPPTKERVAREEEVLVCCRSGRMRSPYRRRRSLLGRKELADYPPLATTPRAARRRSLSALPVLAEELPPRAATRSTIARSQGVAGRSRAARSRIAGVPVARTGREVPSLAAAWLAAPLLGARRLMGSRSVLAA